MVVSVFIASPTHRLALIGCHGFIHDSVWCIEVDSVETLHLGKYTVTSHDLVPCSYHVVNICSVSHISEK